MSCCQDCDEAKATHEDPRSPPLDIGDEVLCYECFYNTAEQVIEEASDEISRLRILQGNQK